MQVSDKTGGDEQDQGIDIRNQADIFSNNINGAL